MSALEYAIDSGNLLTQNRKILPEFYNSIIMKTVIFGLGGGIVFVLNSDLALLLTFSGFGIS